MGVGVETLSSDIRVGDSVTEAQLQLLIGMGRHPVSGELLGRAYPQLHRRRQGRRLSFAPVGGRGLRLHVLDPEVGERALGHCGRSHAGAHR